MGRGQVPQERVTPDDPLDPLAISRDFRSDRSETLLGKDGCDVAAVGRKIGSVRTEAGFFPQPAQAGRIEAVEMGLMEAMARGLAGGLHVGDLDHQPTPRLQPFPDVLQHLGGRGHVLQRMVKRHQVAARRGKPDFAHETEVNRDSQFFLCVAGVALVGLDSPGIEIEAAHQVDELTPSRPHVDNHRSRFQHFFQVAEAVGSDSAGAVDVLRSRSGNPLVPEPVLLGVEFLQSLLGGNGVAPNQSAFPADDGS